MADTQPDPQDVKERLASVNQQVVDEMASLQGRVETLLAAGVGSGLQSRLLELRQDIEGALVRLVQLRAKLEPPSE